METFFSTFVNKVDRKGRVSVPATFRSILMQQSFQGVIAYPSFYQEALEGITSHYLDDMGDRLATLRPLSEEHDELMLLFESCRRLSFDGEGRIILPQDFKDFAGIDDEVVFVGRHDSFQLWEPARYNAALAERRQSFRDKKRSFPPRGGSERGTP